MIKGTCVFCKIIKKEIPSRIVFEDKESLAFEDMRPQAPVHILVIPKDHIEKISDINEDNAKIVGKLLVVANSLAKERNIQESGYRVVLNCNKDAGQEVSHVHMHLLGGRKFTWPPG